MCWLPTHVTDLADGLRCKLGCGDVEEGVSTRTLQRNNLGVDGRVGYFIRSLRNDHACSFSAQAIPEAAQVVLAVIVILKKHGNFGIGLVSQNMLRIQLAFGVVIGVETNGPGMVFRIVPFRCACGQEHVRHFLGIHVPVNSGIGRCAQCAQGQQDFILLYQTANHLHRFGRAVAIV